MKNLILISAILMFLLASCHKWPDDNDVIPTKNLVAYYPFNGNANDESGNKNDGTVHGATLTTDRFGNPNSAYYFNGINNYIEVNNSESLNIVGPITICVWLKTDISNGYGIGVINKVGHVIPFRNGYQTFLGYTTLSFVFDIAYDWANLGGKVAETKSIINDNEWHYDVSVYDRKNLKVYFDSKLEDSTAYSGNIGTNTESLFIGNDPVIDNSGLMLAPKYFRFLKGSLDDIRIYNCALTDKEIIKLYKDCGKKNN